MTGKATTVTEKTVLIVEDDAHLAKILRHQFATAGFHVITAPDSAIGLSCALHKHPDVIILDLLLPNGDGVFFLNRLQLCQQLDRIPKIPVIVLSGVQNEDYERRVQPFDVAAYLHKPYDTQLLIQRVRQLLT